LIIFRRQDHADFRRNVKLFKQTNEQVAVTSNRFDTTSGELVHKDSLVYGLPLPQGGASYFKKVLNIFKIILQKSL